MKKKKYNPEEKPLEILNEPIAAYGAAMKHNVENYQSVIPENTMRLLIESSIEDYKMGRCTPQSEIDSWVKERMGWK